MTGCVSICVKNLAKVAKVTEWVGRKKGNAIMICCWAISLVFLSFVLISSTCYTCAAIFNAVILKIRFVCM